MSLSQTHLLPASLTSACYPSSSTLVGQGGPLAFRGDVEAEPNGASRAAATMQMGGPDLAQMTILGVSQWAVSVWDLARRGTNQIGIVPPTLNNM